MHHPKNRVVGLHSLGFLVVTLAAYLSAVVTMGYEWNRISFPKTAALISLAVLYLANGIYGYTWARGSGLLESALVYFAVQIGIASTLLILTRSPAMVLVMLPLAGQSVVLLPRRWLYAVCALMWLGIVVPLTTLAGPGAGAVFGMFFLAGRILGIHAEHHHVRPRDAMNADAAGRLAHFDLVILALGVVGHLLDKSAGEVEKQALQGWIWRPYSEASRDRSSTRGSRSSVAPHPRCAGISREPPAASPSCSSQNWRLGVWLTSRSLHDPRRPNDPSSRESRTT